jgi:hypothetical protein
LSVIVAACVMPAVSPVITQTIAIMFLIFMFIGVGGYLVGWWVVGGWYFFQPSPVELS